MEGNKSVADSFVAMIKEDRDKRKKSEIASKMLGRGRRPTPPVAPRAIQGAGLAERAGITKRNTSVPRAQERRTHNARLASSLGRVQATDDIRSILVTNASVPRKAKESVPPAQGARNGDTEMTIKGAASVGPHVVIASNFMSGTTSADIETVMQAVGGEMTSCTLVAVEPAVVAEMAFVDRAGAEKVINHFNNKKADGRVLHVYFKAGGGVTAVKQPAAHVESPPKSEVEQETMDLDEEAESREAQNRLREERRGRDDYAEREDVQSQQVRTQEDYRRNRHYPENYGRGRPAQDHYRGGRQNPGAYNYHDGRYGSGGGGGGGRGYNGDFAGRWGGPRGGGYGGTSYRY